MSGLHDLCIPFLFQAYKLNMYGSRHVWILMGKFLGNWWETSAGTSCTKEQLSKVADKYFTVSSFNASGNNFSIGNIVSWHGNSIFLLTWSKWHFITRQTFFTCNVLICPFLALHENFIYLCRNVFSFDSSADEPICI